MERLELTFCLGNCLFHALSDQLHGDQSHADEIRAAVVREMRQNPKTYRPFATSTGGQEPRYKMRGRKSADPAGAIERELEPAWLRYLNEMSKPTKFADNLEVQAFANSFKIDVKIYQEKTKKILYMRAASRDATKVVHLARHVSASFLRCLEAPKSQHQLIIFCRIGNTIRLFVVLTDHLMACQVSQTVHGMIAQ